MTTSPRARSAFTLIELLVVVGIIAVLASITVVMLSSVRKSADRTRIGFQLHSLSAGLDAYQTQFGSYPITVAEKTPGSTTAGDYFINREGLRGARLLCKALMGACVGSTNTDKTLFDPTKPNQDGKDGPGFAVPGRSGIYAVGSATGELRGQTFPPFLAVDKFPMSKTATVAPSGGAIGDLVAGNDWDDTTVLLDGNGHPILYWPVLNAQAPTSVADAGVSRGKLETTPAVTYAGTPMLNGTDNEAWLLPTVLRKEIGLGPAEKYGTPSADGSAFDPRTPTNPQRDDNRIQKSGEKILVTLKYVLWSAGPDGIFGPNMAGTGKSLGAFDDVTNFQGE